MGRKAEHIMAKTKNKKQKPSLLSGPGGIVKVCGHAGLSSMPPFLQECWLTASLRLHS